MNWIKRILSSIDDPTSKLLLLGAVSFTVAFSAFPIGIFIYIFLIILTQHRITFGIMNLFFAIAFFLSSLLLIKMRPYVNIGNNINTYLYKLLYFFILPAVVLFFVICIGEGERQLIKFLGI